MSDTHFILTGIGLVIVFAIITPITFYLTRSLLFALVVGFVIVEVGLVILAMNREGFFLWFCVIFLMPIYHLGLLVGLSRREDENSTVEVS